MLQAFSFILSLVLVVIFIIMVVKFFQIASDVKEISRLLSLRPKAHTPPPSLQKEVTVDGIRLGSHVVEIKTKKQMNVIEIVNESGDIKFRCSPNKGITSELFKRGEIELFKVLYPKE